MPVWCQLCELSFEEPLELQVHYLSLSHHIKLEANNPVVHSCSPCGISGLSLGEYSKHVDTEDHRRKRERIRAIIDTMDAGEGPRVHFNFNRDRSQHMTATPSYLEPTSSFVRSGFQRSTYPFPKAGEGTRSHHTRSRRPNQQFCGEAFEGSSSSQRSVPLQTDTNPSRSGDEWARGLLHSYMRIAPPTHDRCPDQFETDGHFLNDAEQLDFRCAGEERCDMETSEDSVPPQKRGLLARLSLRRKGKAAKMSSSEKSAREKDKKTKRKKSQSRSPASPSLKTKAGESESPSRRRAAVLNVALEDKTKKWELVAVKGKASYLKNRSQRMFKDRMNKYRLVDSKGMVVEDIQEEATSSNNSRATNAGKREANVPQFASHIWGTGPEAIPRSQRSNFQSEALRVSKLPSVPLPCVPPTSSGGSSQEESSSGYATLNVLPMSTPKNYNAAMRAYENYEDRKLDVSDRVSDSKVSVFGVVSANTDTISTVSELDSSCSSLTSSLAVESHSLTSRLNLTIANADRCADVVTVKEETVDSPPPDALPSPPQFEQTMQLQNSTTEGRIAGDKERDEFWALGIAEHKKGHEILDMRAKVEKLQKELIEATSCLQKLEVEMNEILRRKSELLGLAAPHNAT